MFQRTSQARPNQQNDQKTVPIELREDHYDVLGLKRNCTAAEIKKTYKKLALKWHPDKNPNNRVKAEAVFKRLNDAYGVLSDPESRGQYNEILEKQHVTAYQQREEDIRSNNHSEENIVRARIQQLWEDARIKKEFEEVFSKELEIHAKSWSDELRRIIRKYHKGFRYTSFYLFLLVARTKYMISLDLLDSTSGYLLLELLDSDFFWWLIKPSNQLLPMDLIEEFSKSNDVLQEETNDWRRYQFRLFMIEKILGKNHKFFSVIDEDVNARQMYGIIFEYIVQNEEPITKMKIMLPFLENKGFKRYFCDIYNHLIVPAEEKIARLMAAGDSLSINKAHQLKYFVKNTIPKCLYESIFYKMHRGSVFGIGASDIHYEFIYKYKVALAAPVIDKRKNVIKDILRGLLGVLLGIISIGIAFGSGHFVSYFFYSESRAMLNKGVEELEQLQMRCTYHRTF